MYYFLSTQINIKIVHVNMLTMLQQTFQIFHSDSVNIAIDH